MSSQASASGAAGGDPYKQPEHHDRAIICSNTSTRARTRAVKNLAESNTKNEVTTTKKKHTSAKAEPKRGGMPMMSGGGAS